MFRQKLNLAKLLAKSFRLSLCSVGIFLSMGLAMLFSNTVYTVSGYVPAPQCSDLIDNDSDGYSDINDVGCHSDRNPNNPNSYNLADDDESDDNIGSIRACKIIVDEQGVISDGASNQGEFVIPGSPGPSWFVPNRKDPIPTTNFSTPLNLNTDLVNGDGINDAECHYYDGLTLSNYFYGEEVITGSNWQEPLYFEFFDQVTITVSLSQFATYSPEWFAENPQVNPLTDPNRNDTSDGLIDYYIPPEDYMLHTTLVVLNIYHTSEPINQPPIITLLGANPMSLQLNATFTDPGATSSDPEDGDLTSSIVITGSVNTSATGTYTLTYSVTDSGGLTASTTRTVDVVEGLEPPCGSYGDIAIDGIINWLDFFEYAVHGSGGFDLSPEQQARADVNRDGNIDVADAILVEDFITGKISTFPVCHKTECSDLIDNDGDGLVDENDPGCENQNDDSENQMPVITVLGANPMSLQLNATFTDPGATSSDPEDGDLTSSIVITGSVNTSATGTYTLTYSVTDSGGLTASTTRTVDVVEAPVVSYQCSDSMDNDGDGKIDAQDPGCWADPQNSQTYVPQDDNEAGEPEPPQPPPQPPVIYGGGGGGGAVITANAPVLYIFDEELKQQSSSTALVSWKTNIPANSKVVYGLSSAAIVDLSALNYGYASSTLLKDELVLTHSVLIEELKSAENYYFRPVSKAPESQLAFGKELSIATTSIPAPVSTTSVECVYLLEYLKMGRQNNPEEVKKLQRFLRDKEGFTALLDTGFFDQQTFDAVSIFQARYKEDVLTPWSYNEPTGYVYITTKKKINEIYCQKPFPLTQEQTAEINNFRALSETLPVGEIKPNEIIGKQEGEQGEAIAGIGQGQQGAVESSVGSEVAGVPTTSSSGIALQELEGSDVIAQSESQKEANIQQPSERNLLSIIIAGLSSAANPRILYWLALLLTVAIVVLVSLLSRLRKKRVVESYTAPAISGNPFNI